MYDNSSSVEPSSHLFKYVRKQTHCKQRPNWKLAINHAVIQLWGICNLVPYHFFHRQQLLQLVLSLGSVQRTISMHITTRALIQQNSWGKSTIDSSCRQAGRQKAEFRTTNILPPKNSPLLAPSMCKKQSSYISLYSPQHHPAPLNSSHSGPPPVTVHQHPRPKSLTSRPQHPRHVWPRHLRRCRSYPKQRGPNVAHLRLVPNKRKQKEKN